jgi:hypothetical protein
MSTYQNPKQREYKVFTFYTQKHRSKEVKKNGKEHINYTLILLYEKKLVSATAYMYKL